MSAQSRQLDNSVNSGNAEVQLLRTCLVVGYRVTALAEGSDNKLAEKALENVFGNFLSTTALCRDNRQAATLYYSGVAP